jgi:4-amino-4-deoxy-L-arabinose transferase-like glycosyltransferase
MNEGGNLTMKTKQGQRFDVILIGIALLSAFLNIYNIWKETYANAYYTSAVTSMLQSWHNFFFASFDPAGFITVDKPPVTFWVQTIFAYIFGVHGWSVILPQALAGVGSVLLIYALVKPNFGKTAARFASLIMACTPIAVAVSRTNNIDSLLVFTLLLATWMLFKAIRHQKLSWVLGAFAMIGIGFNMKMLQAYMVVPAFYLFYLLAFKGEWKRKLAILAAATVVLVTVSLSWAVIVDTTPQANRPYIGGSKTNSVLELAFGYNGMQRLTGMNGGGGTGSDAKGGGMPNQLQMQNEKGGRQDGSMPEGFKPNGSMPPGYVPDGNGGRSPMSDFSGKGPQGGGMGSGSFGTGQAGPLRLLQSELSGQISWLLPLVAFACVGLLAGISRRKKLTAKQNETLFWLAWLLPGMAFFSVAGFFHQYYLIMLAPPIAVLAGAGWVELWKQYRNKEGWKIWLLPSAMLVTTAFELYILQPYQKQVGIGWSIGIGVAGIAISLILFFLGKKEKLASIAAVAGILVLLVAPLYWAATPILYGDNSMLPQAGPTDKQGFGTGQGMGGGMTSTPDAKLLAYLSKNNTGEKYFLITTDANTAESYIISTGKAVVAMGGFSGSDPALTVKELEQMVKNQEVKYFLIPSGSGVGGKGSFGGGSTEVLNWIRAHSTEVPKAEWQSKAAEGVSMGKDESKTLYLINQ